MAGSFNNMRRGGSSMQRGRFGSGVGRFGGNTGSQKLVSGSNNNSVNNGNTGQKQFSDGVDRFRAQSPWHSTGKSPWSGWRESFRGAIFGKAKKSENAEKAITDQRKSEKDLPSGILDMQIKVDSTLKPGEEKYNYRKNLLSISGEKGIDRKDLPKKIIKIAKDSKRFRDTTGMGTVTRQDRRKLNTALRRKRLRVERANRQLLSSATKRSRTKSASRKITFGDLVK